ncbi:MAG: hypothetical protein AB8B92_00840 [Gammaproteobacteria bacterium]
MFFSLGSVQAGTHYCVSMDMQDESSNNMTGEMPDDMSVDQTSCHLQAEELDSKEKTNNSCCDEDCGSCTSVVVTFNTLINNYEATYTERYKQYGPFFVLTNHIKIPTPPPNA